MITPDGKPPRILALDLMTHTGWAARAADGGVLFGTKDFTPKSMEGAGMRWYRFRNWLSMMALETGCEMVFFEQPVGFPRKNMGRDQRVFDSFAAHVTEFCERQHLPYRGIGVGKIKTFATGKGNASKEAVFDAVRKLGYYPLDDNQSDAIALLLLAESEWAASGDGGGGDRDGES